MTLKIKKEHLEHLRTQLEAYLAANPGIVEKYRARDIVRAEHVRDINKRFRWDFMDTWIPAKWICDNLYPYIDDRHIDSALRAICPTVE